MRLKVALLSTVVPLIVAAPALAWSNGDGNSANAPGQAIAKENCHDAYVTQSADVEAGGGPKAAETGPLNCDHYWQNIAGAIGSGP
jgi:hypothetical protein